MLHSKASAGWPCCQSKQGVHARCVSGVHGGGPAFDGPLFVNAKRQRRRAQLSSLRPLALALTCFVATGCAQYAVVKERRPVFQPEGRLIGALVAAEQRIKEGLRWDRRHPKRALGKYLVAARQAAEQLERDPDNKAALESYNFAVARIISAVQRLGEDPWSKPLQVDTPEGAMVVTHRPDPRPQWNPALYDFKPADQFDVRGTHVSEREIKEGIGAPLVAVGKVENPRSREDFGPDRVYYGVTGVLRFDGNRAEIAFEDPLAKETVRLSRRSFPLAADFTVPLAVMLEQANPRQFEIRRLLRPEKYAETARISRLQPYDPDKTVVLVVHGLMDTPATWAPMINRLRNDEAIRRNYQFWFFSYPSGYPYPYSAALLRRELDAVTKRFPLRRKIVLVGHSMGGCISRLMITDAGDELWQSIFRKSRAETRLSEASRELFESSLVFKRRPEVGRVIFMAAPLRGADMATHWTGRIGSMLVRTPARMMQAGADALGLVALDHDDLRIRRMPNSIDTLAPNNRFVRALNTIPVAHGVPCHVVTGDRGRGGNRDQTRPVMSDGIVPFWSSYMPGAQSELIVPSDHSVQRNSEAKEEVRRILRKYAQR